MKSKTVNPLTTPSDLLVSAENKNHFYRARKAAVLSFSCAPSGLFPHVRALCGESTWRTVFGLIAEAVYAHCNYFAVDLFKTPACNRHKLNVCLEKRGRYVTLFSKQVVIVCYFIRFYFEPVTARNFTWTCMHPHMQINVCVRAWKCARLCI